jgi:hypothetical protein
MASYAAHFRHQFVIDNFSLHIKLPKRTNIIDSVPPRNGSAQNQLELATVAFQKQNIPIDDYFSYHLVFGATRRIILTLYGLGLLTFGFGLGMLTPTTVATKTKQVIEILGSFLLLVSASAAHHLGEAFVGGSVFGALKKRFGSKSSP